jgi:serine/threonine protein kinase
MRYGFKEGFEDESIISTILYQTLLGLEYIQKNGTVHRDIKAGNLLIDSSGIVQIADFGVASTLLESDQRRIRKTFVGTPCWMAPEVMEMNPSGYDFKADIWSLGITALELALGSAPYSKFPPMKIIYMTLTQEPPNLPKGDKFSKNFRNFLECCLQKDPKKRHSPELLLKHAFIKNAKKPSYLVENLICLVPPIHLRAKNLKDGQFEEMEKAFSNNHIPLWTFDDYQPDKCEELEEPKTLSSGLRSIKKGRFLILDTENKPEQSEKIIFQEENPDCSSGINSPNKSDQKKCNPRKGRFSIVENPDFTIKVVANSIEANNQRSSTNSNKIGRFQIEQVEESGKNFSDSYESFLANTFDDINGKNSKFLKIDHISRIDQLILLNDLIRQHLIELKQIGSISSFRSSYDTAPNRSLNEEELSSHKSSMSLPSQEFSK